MTKEELAKRVYKACSLKGEFVLRSGQNSDQYFDKYLFEADPELFGTVASHLLSMVPDGVDALAGLEMGGIPIATVLSLKTGTRALFVRKKAKEYGTCKLAEGGEVARQKLLIIEDVVTSGGAILDAVRELRELGAIVDEVLCVIDREGSAVDNLRREGLTLKSLFTKSFLEKMSRA